MEFVIIFPTMVLFLLLMVWFSLFIATLSDLHQLAADLTRQTLRLRDLEPDPDDLCDRLRRDVAPSLVASLHFLHPTRVVAIDCAILADPPVSRVAVTYNLDHFGATTVGRLLGWDLSQVTRQATMVW